MTNLPLDVIHNIVTQSSDFECLHTAISSSKIIRNVYEKTPASIMRQVAENIVGPNLMPPVLRLIRWIIFEKDEGYKSRPDNSPYTTDLSNEDQVPKDYVLTWKEAKYFQDYGMYASIYEDQFSRRRVVLLLLTVES